MLLFARDQRSLDEALPEMLSRMAPETALWICWPKKTSPLASDVTGDTVRRTGLGAGVVDIKVCAIDEDWSGLQFVVRLQDRPAGPKKVTSLGQKSVNLLQAVFELLGHPFVVVS